MKTEDLKIFLQDITFNSEYKFLEQGTDDKEIEAVAKRHKLDVGNDLAILKILYAYTDRFNKNGCRLPKDEVKKSLGSIKGRILDEDHLRKAVRGFMLEGSVEGNEIIVYAAFFKSSFPDRYDVLKEMIAQKQLAVSFEAYGKRNFINANQYDLIDISFAGCGLLYTTNPAFEGAKVLEAAKVNELVLEYANEFKSSDELIHLERARYHLHDINTVTRMMNEASCPNCKTMSPYTVDAINFKANTAQATCWDCQNPYDIMLTPQTSPAQESAKKDSSIDDKSGKNKQTEDSKNMDEIKKLQEELASIKEALTTAKTENEALKKEVEEAKASLTKATEEFEKAKAELTEKFDKEKAEESKLAGEKAVKIATRKTELADFAKDMKDEDILDDVKFENAKLKKENAELKKAKGPITANVNTETNLEVGSKDDNVNSDTFKTQDNIKNLAFKTPVNKK